MDTNTQEWKGKVSESSSGSRKKIRVRGTDAVPRGFREGKASGTEVPVTPVLSMAAELGRGLQWRSHNGFVGSFLPVKKGKQRNVTVCADLYTPLASTFIRG
jgi:hypothetical protein